MKTRNAIATAFARLLLLAGLAGSCGSAYVALAADASEKTPAAAPSPEPADGGSDLPQNGQARPDAPPLADQAAASSAAGDQGSASRPEADVAPRPAARIATTPLAPAVVPANAGPEAPAGQTSTSVSARPPARGHRLPIFGLGADIGLPDGASVSLLARPWPWLRLQAGVGSNSISHGWRAGLSLLPFSMGPALTAEYGRYQEGDANALASKLLGSGFRPSPLLQRVGYEYLNLQAGLNFGFERVVFFVQGGLGLVRGRLRNLDQALSDAAAPAGSTEVTVSSEPSVKATVVSGKLGFIVYIW